MRSVLNILRIRTHRKDSDLPGPQVDLSLDRASAQSVPSSQRTKHKDPKLLQADNED